MNHIWLNNFGKKLINFIIKTNCFFGYIEVHFFLIFIRYIGDTMNIYELNNIIEGKITNIHKKIYKNIQTDTRKIDNESLLFVFNLKHDNAYKYVRNMKIRPAIIVINDYEENIENISCIKVKNTIKAYSMLASYYKNKKYIPTIMITGSVGKTTTKDLIYDILSMSYKCKKTEGSKNNILGISNMLLSVKDEKILIVEAGSNHLGEIDEIADVVKPDIAVVTKIGTSHIGNFGNIKNIFKEKTNYINESVLAFINGKDKYLKQMKGNNIYKVGKKNFKIKNIKIKNNISFKTNNVKLEFNSLNKDLITNVALAFYIGLLFNVPINKIKLAIKNYKFPDHRQNIISIKNTIIVDDTYNASYESVISSIKSLKRFHKSKILILGDIYELGNKTDEIHNKIIKKTKKYRLYTVGNNFKHKNNFKTKEELFKFLKTINLNNKVILVKASRKMEFEKIVTFIKEVLEKDY